MRSLSCWFRLFNDPFVLPPVFGVPLGLGIDFYPFLKQKGDFKLDLAAYCQCRTSFLHVAALIIVVLALIVCPPCHHAIHLRLTLVSYVSYRLWCCFWGFRRVSYARRVLADTEVMRT